MSVCSGCVADHAIRLSAGPCIERVVTVGCHAVLVVDGLCVLFVMCLLLCALPTGWTVPRRSLAAQHSDQALQWRASRQLMRPLWPFTSPT